MNSIRTRGALFAGLALILAATAVPAPQPAPAAPPIDGGWPRVVATSAGTFTIYQPQLDSWDGHRIAARCAVSLTEKEGSQPVFGVVWAEAVTRVDKDTRLVTFSDREFKKAAFPSAPDKEAHWLEVMRREVQPQVKTIALDRMTAMMEVAEADKAMRAIEVKNDPPSILFSKRAAILVYVDGAPVYRPIKDTKLERLINTKVLVVRDKKGKHNLRLFDGWLESPALEGPWSVPKKTSPELEKALADAKASGQVDLLPGGNPNDPKSLPTLRKTGKIPDIVVTAKPTELIVTEGEPDYVPIEGTQLLYVKNTTGHVFRHLSDQKTYVLLSGRWFRAERPEGPWDYVASDALPEDFAKIPDDSPKENVKASVAGTPQAKEALIANSIPQTAEVKIKEARIDPPKFDGDPQLAPIEGTELRYVVNTATPVIQVSANSYYAVQNGVWFTAGSVSGPWMVATSVPSVIYTIPPSSPMHHVTYVRVYQSTPDVVVVSYTPGYYGTCVSHGTVVYGTGYYYTPWVGTVWYGPPVTYGGAVAMTYTPWTGWAMGFGYGWSWGAVTVGWGWGTYPWWGPYGWGYYYPYPYYRPAYWGGAAWGPWGAAAWGPGGWAATTGNVYHRWGSTSAVTRRSGGYNAWTGTGWRSAAGMSYNSRTGNLAAGQRAAVGNVYTGNYAYGSRGAVTNTRTGNTVSGGRVTGGNVYTGQSGSAGYVRGEQGGAVRVGDDVYAGKDGNVYRRGDGGWEQHQSGGGWSSVEGGSRAGSLDAEQRARSTGATRTQNYGNYRSGAGRGYGGGGARRGGGGRRR